MVDRARVEFGVLVPDDPGWRYGLRLLVWSDPGRTLVVVYADGVITLANDMTIEEARSVIEQLVPLVVRNPVDQNGHSALISEGSSSSHGTEKTVDRMAAKREG